MEVLKQDSQKQIDLNIQIHDKIAQQYEKVHGEIFNEIEQNRLSRDLKKAVELVQAGQQPLKALDYGCGSGNLTQHLLHFDLEVTAADVSAHFLKLVQHRYQTNKLSVLQLNGRDLSNIDSESFDFIALYSVLHHIPDYLSAVEELARVCKPGGVIYMDHENNPDYWLNKREYNEFIKKAKRFDVKKYLNFYNYIHKVRSLFNPRYSNEGDIHVWPDDHIEWSLIEDSLVSNGFEVVLTKDYLHYNRLYRMDVFRAYENRLSDMRVMAFRRRL